MGQVCTTLAELLFPGCSEQKSATPDLREKGRRMGMGNPTRSPELEPKYHLSSRWLEETPCSHMEPTWALQLSAAGSDRWSQADGVRVGVKVGAPMSRLTEGP